MRAYASIGEFASLMRVRTCTRRHRAHSSGGATQKAMLLAVYATEGEEIRLDQLADMAGTSHAAASRALNALMLLGLVRTERRRAYPRRGGLRPRVYRVSWVEVAKAGAVAILTP